MDFRRIDQTKQPDDVRLECARFLAWMTEQKREALRVLGATRERRAAVIARAVTEQ